MSDYDCTEIASKIAKSENIQKHRFEHRYSSNKGDGYSGSVCALKIIGTNKEIDVVIKISHRDPKIHEFVQLHELYSCEINFYEVIASAYKRFQAEYNISQPFNNIPEYYASISTPHNECLAMENIKCMNYDLWNREKEMNQAHLEMALKTFAKFHGTSMAMKILNPELFSQIVPGKNNDTIMIDILAKCDIFKSFKKTILSLKQIEPLCDTLYQEKLEYLYSNIEPVVTKINSYHDMYDVILQGDCWCNNAMYFYEDLNDRSQPANIKLLDWQFVKLGCIVNDLSYFFYSIAPKESIDNLDYFLKFYHEALANHLEEFGLNIDDVYPFTIFMEQWANNALFGLFLAFAARKIALVQSEDAPVIGDGTEDFLSNMVVASDKMELYNQQMINIIQHFVDRKFIKVYCNILGLSIKKGKGSHQFFFQLILNGQRH